MSVPLLTRFHLLVVSFPLVFLPHAAAQIQIEPGVPLHVVPFSSTRGFPAFPPPGDPNFTAYVYSTGPSGQQLVAYDESGTATVLGGLQLDFGLLHFGRGATLGRLFAAECCRTAIAPDGVYEVSPSGGVTVFNLLGGEIPTPTTSSFQAARSVISSTWRTRTLEARSPLSIRASPG